MPKYTQELCTVVVVVVVVVRYLYILAVILRLWVICFINRRSLIG